MYLLPYLGIKVFLLWYLYLYQDINILIKYLLIDLMMY